MIVVRFATWSQLECIRRLWNAPRDFLVVTYNRLRLLNGWSAVPAWSHTARSHELIVSIEMMSSRLGIPLDRLRIP